MFTLAHLSDVHLGPMPEGAAWRNFALKRPIGYLSWQLKRHKLHDPAVAEAIAADIRAAKPDHVALTGDIVNIAAYDEFPAAAKWLRRLGSPQDVTFVPGNHDTYVKCGWEHGLGFLAPWMTGDMRVMVTQMNGQIATPFPFVRLRKNVALIGLSSAIPQPLHLAGGALGAKQLESLAVLLRDLREKGYARVVLIHHPPFPGLAVRRKALRDASALRGVIEQEGAELILHGHNHRHLLTPLKSRFGMVHALGVPSASMALAGKHTPAAWYRYTIDRVDGRWQAGVTVRAYDPATRRIATASEFMLST